MSKFLDSKYAIVFVGASLMFSGTISAKQPNIILILADDMGYGDISALNENSKIRTPQLDALAHRGRVFTDAHSNSSVSTPSRYGIMTGRYAFRTNLRQGVLDGFSTPLIAPDRSTIPAMLGQQGYTSACIGKWHLGWDWAKTADGEVDYTKPIANGPADRGFDYFFGINASLDMPPYVYVENRTVTAAPNRRAAERKGLQLFRSGPIGADLEPEDCFPNITRHAISYINDHQRAVQPFFLYVPITAPHTPILPSPEFQGKSGLSPYGDFVLMIDDMIGQVVSALDKQGLLNNTIIIFTSDNGCAPYAGMEEMEKQGHDANYIYRGSKSDLYDGGHRVPLIVRWGNHFKGDADNSIVSLTDFYATFAQMSGYTPADNQGEDSYSLWPVLNGTGKSARTSVVHHSINGSFAIRDSRWKLLFCGGSGGWSYPSMPKDAEYLATQPAMQLFDMEKDPRETRNVVEQHPKVVARLTESMRQYLTQGRSTPGKPQKNDSDKAWPQAKLFLK